MIDIYYCFLNVFCLFIWFHTEAFIEYIRYIPPLSKLLKVKEYIEFQKTKDYLNYPLYLSVYYNNFFTKLISCPYCLLFWINILSLLLLDNKIFIFVNYVISLVIYIIVIIMVKKYESINNKH